MRLQEHANKLETNVKAETQNFGIGDASVVIEILRNRLYEHKIRTLVQEYICNARDAMRELGKGNEFEITVPNNLNPVFKVRDFGPGISPNRMKDVFVMYGASTKRGTNSQTGGFGIGAKSAWSYTDSFTITTFIDGVKRVYVAHTGVNNNGRLDHVSTSETTEANGTEIQVPVNKHDVREFRESIYRAIYFWKEKPALKGELDQLTLTEGFRLNDTVEIIDGGMVPNYAGFDNYGDDFLAVIDGVPYPITRKLMEKTKKFEMLRGLVRKKIIFHFGNGVVEVSASRESIADSKLSVDALEKMAKDAISAIKLHVSKQFAKVKDAKSYFNTYRELAPYFNLDGFAKFDKYEINGGYIRSELFKKVKMTDITTRGRYGRNGKMKKEELSEQSKYVDLNKVPLIYFMKGEESIIKVNKRLREHFSKHQDMILIEALNGDVASLDKIIGDLEVKDFQSIQWVEQPKEPKVKVEREAEAFCAHVPSQRDRHVYMTLNDNEQEYLYVPLQGTSWGDYDSGLLGNLCQYLQTKEDKKVCGLSAKVIKHIAGDKNFKPLEDWLNDYKPSKRHINYVKRMYSENSDLMEIVVLLKDVEDEFLAEMAKEYKGFKQRADEEHVPEMLVEIIKKTDEFKEFEKKDKELTKVLKGKYSLLDHFSRWNIEKYLDDITVFINAKHKVK